VILSKKCFGIQGGSIPPTLSKNNFFKHKIGVKK